MFTLCCRYTGNDDEARDLMHDSILKALAKMSNFSYQGKGSLPAWISRIAINTALDSIGRNKLRPVRLIPAISDTMTESDEERLTQIPQDKLFDLISELPDVQRAIFNMYCLDGYSHKEIAAELGISEKGSSSLLVKARNYLKKRIEEYYKDSEQE